MSIMGRIKRIFPEAIEEEDEVVVPIGEDEDEVDTARFRAKEKRIGKVKREERLTLPVSDAINLALRS